MSNSETAPKVDKEVLRVALDKEAMAAYHKMTAELKQRNEFVKVQPSAFISFLVSDFLKSHFQDDADLLVAQFFDSQGYYETQLKEAKASASFEQTMSDTLAFIKRVKTKAIRRATGMKKAKVDAAASHD